MKPTLELRTVTMELGEIGPECSLPDLSGSFNIQNKTAFFLEEEDEIYEGYGKRSTAYPYRQQNGYTRQIAPRETQAAILENDHLQAVFLPQYGGRLWALMDKHTGQNLLYTNDVVRPSNLAIRNAWFSGGVEWNIGMIGHTPLTCEPLFAAMHQLEDGTPVLRMYEYERVRGVEYQMDFWIGESDRWLTCRMRIVNHQSQLVPMYWWSNMAVPEYQNGRIAVPASRAFTNRADGIYKVEIPLVEGVDVSHPTTIPRQVDYFFDIPQESPKYIANLDSTGYGLLHTSTARLRSRKLFSWGNSTPSDRWQQFLTRDAGRYLEIQAGLGKTQYGCLPMAPHTAWEWMERYGPVQLEADAVQLPFDGLCQQVEQQAQAQRDGQQEMLTRTKPMAKSRAQLVLGGSGHGALCNLCRAAEGEQPLSGHLDFGGLKARQKPWAALLESGHLAPPAQEQPPEDFQRDDLFYQALRQATQTVDQDNWYAHYQLGCMDLDRGKGCRARRSLHRALELSENPWTLHAAAVVAEQEGDPQAAVTLMARGLALREQELGYLKEGYALLLRCGGQQELIASYTGLSQELRQDSRLTYGYIQALHRVGQTAKAYSLLTDNGGLILDDLRECDGSIGQLWRELHTALHPDQQDAPIPFIFDFDSL